MVFLGTANVGAAQADADGEISLASGNFLNLAWKVLPKSAALCRYPFSLVWHFL